ncbi:MAG: transporter permease [Firmicutes bacterium]|nr:transporter permease [Bacillota bacterium]
MLRFIVHRFFGFISIMFIVSIVIFSITRMIPGDPAAVLLGPQATLADIEAMRERLGLNQPYLVQYASFLTGLLHGDLGTSIYYHQSVMSLILERLPNTIILGTTALAIAITVAIPMGVLSATKQYSLWDYGGMMVALIGVSMPVFWLGLMLVLLFSVNLGWLPATGMGSMKEGLWDFISHLILPSIALSTIPMATLARITRSSTLEVIRSDYVRTARAKGLSETVVIWKHAFRNALIPLLTVLGLQISNMLSGAVLTETIFSWPGMGRLIVDAIEKRDFVMVQGNVLFVVTIFVTVNLIIDILYAVANPKISVKSTGRE